MTNLEIGLAGVIVLLAAMFARIPIAVSLALVGAGGYAAIDGWHTALAVVASVPFELASAYSLSVVPLFILMGAVASRAQMSRELFDAANAVFSGFRGALASATVGACAAFGAICGSSIATAATFSKVAIPEMRRHGYNDIVAAGSVAAAGTLGILIPPSVILAVYSLVAEQSLAKLFAAALFPGILLAALYVVAVVIQARLRPQWMPRVPPMPLRERLRAARGMWKLVLLFFFAVVGIYLGWFSPTEGAAISAFAAIVIGFATRTLSLRGLSDAFLETVYSSAMLFFIIVGAFIFARFIVLTRLPNELAVWVQAAQLSPLAIVLAVIVLYVVLGTALEEVSTILITVPVILP
ncbi:MAG: TRAP transporter large permease, partial [Betaproteobacteria bacterium]